MLSDFHHKYMQRCLQLARLGVGNIAPNPMVGAVLVYKDVIIAEGYHQQYGGPHAEVNCINNALKNHPEKIASSTLYVSLEPCAHYGKTPPCADLIIQHKIPNVVIACRDSFDKVDGKGILKLKAAGINVTTGVLEKEAIELNKSFFTFHEEKRPYIILKWAQTADGFMDSLNDERLIISNHYSNRLVHQWRSEFAAIMIGANTVIKDNPLLNNRLWFGNPPRKVIFDPNLKVPTHLNLFNQEDEVVVFNCIKNDTIKNINFIKIDKANMLNDILYHLHQLQIQSLFIEGGKILLQSFIDEDLWDEARVIVNNNMFIEKGLAAPQLSNNEQLNEMNLMKDKITFFKHKTNNYIHAVT